VSVEALKLNRNYPCPCGSGIKFKKCCMDKKNIDPLQDLKEEPHPKDQLNLEASEKTLSNRIILASNICSYWPIIALQNNGLTAIARYHTYVTIMDNCYLQ
jgi:hypothetical protein